MKTKADIIRQIEVLKKSFLKPYVGASIHKAMLAVIEELEAKIAVM
jgi:hypothetical protein